MTTKRFATHQMMAAGHPRLAFELDTYTELWRTSGGHEHFRRDADYFARKGPFEPVQTWLAGLTAATRAKRDLVEQRIAVANGGFPDFALYNCYSCHRSMRVAAWEKPDDGDDAPPGTLRLHDGHARALLAVLEATAPSLAAAAAATRSTALQSANGNPAHDPRRERVAATGARAHRAEEHRAAHGIAPTWKRRSMRSSPRRNAATFVDYAAAEQAAMGMVLLLAELDPDGPRTRPTSKRCSIRCRTTRSSTAPLRAGTRVAGNTK